MDARIVIPIVEERGMDAPLSQHFGRAPYFFVVDIDEKGDVVAQRAVPNTSEHFGGTGTPAERILELKPNAVITYGMGPRALNYFQGARVAVLRAEANTAGEAVSAYKDDVLEELTEGCRHAQHH